MASVERPRMFAAATALVLPDVGQRPDAGDVADRPHALAGRHPRVDLDPAPAGLDPDRVQPETVGSGLAAGRDERSPRNSSRSGNSSTYSPSSTRTADACCPKRSSMPSLRKASPSASHNGFGSRQEVIHALDECDRRSHSVHGLGHFDADGSAAEDDHLLRYVGERGGLAIRPHALRLGKPGNRRDHRVRPGGDHDVRGAVLLLADRHPAGTGEPARGHRQVDPPWSSSQPTLLESW